jgi:hypothetical protein
MFYTLVVQRRWIQPGSQIHKSCPTSKISEVEATKEKNSKFASAKTTEYIRNAQQAYYLERRMFS